MNTTRKRRPWRTLVLTLAALALAALIVAGLWPKPLPVQTRTISRGPMTEIGRASCRERV